MFHSIPEPVLDRMRELEQLDRQDRLDGTEHDRRLRQVPQEVGRLLAILASFSPPGAWLEIGTSAGYSALWICQAGRAAGRKLVTYEILPHKAALARETFRRAGVESLVELREGDGLEGLQAFERLAFCFLDADKAHALEYLDAIVPRLIPGGVFAFDNAISHQDRIGAFLERVQQEPLLDTVLLSIGKGLLICRRVRREAV